jgi:hypothetical protein
MFTNVQICFAWISRAEGSTSHTQTQCHTLTHIYIWMTSSFFLQRKQFITVTFVCDCNSLIMIITLAMNNCQISHSPKQCYMIKFGNLNQTVLQHETYSVKLVNHYCFYLLKYCLYHKLLEVRSRASLCKYWS